MKELAVAAYLAQNDTELDDGLKED
jgi:hypothetical protein